MSDAATHVSTRWQLSRAGIVNVYQYENETIDFAGGRLLLRGVNGSGKSTAMNMLLPFLLTARVRGIDAAGEQTGVLKSWMLSGRDEAQPVGYLWIEFARTVDDVTEHLVIGCGIRANRSTDNVTTWWFVTTQRPGHDIALVESGVPLTADALRVALEPDPVFAESRRADYRREVSRRLYGGADLDQFLDLLNTVRSPRVGDRVDVDLPEHLVGALPALSEQALIEAARPLDDLDEHRRNVADLNDTSSALAAMADVYRNHVLTEIHRAAVDAKIVLSESDSARRRERRAQQAESDAAQAESDTDVAAAELDGAIQRLGEEIAALERSPEYTEGLALDDLRTHVASLRSTLAEQEARVDRLTNRAPALEREVRDATTRADGDLAALAADISRIDAASTAATLTVRPPNPPSISRTALHVADGPDLTRPEAAFVAGPIRSRLDEVAGAAQLRTADVDLVRTRIATVTAEETELRAAEALFGGATGRLADATDAFDDARRRLAEATDGWDAAVGTWVRDAAPRFVTAEVAAPAVFALDDPHGLGQHDVGQHNRGQHGVAATDRHRRRQALATDAASLVDHAQRGVIAAEHDVATSRTAVDEARQVVDELAAITEPEPPTLPWQTRTGPGFADLVDFAPGLDESDRAGLEAALEASGLLAASVGPDGVSLAEGELVARPGPPADRSLAHHLVVVDAVADVEVADVVTELLASVSTDPAGDSAAIMSTSGEFRLGSLRGRHTKAVAEHVGVSARRAALERLRADAAADLRTAAEALDASETTLDRARAEAAEIMMIRDALPDLSGVDAATAVTHAAESAVEAVRGEVERFAELVADADRRLTAASNDLERTANSLHLPIATGALDSLARTLDDIVRDCRSASSSAVTVERSCTAWLDAIARWEVNHDDIAVARADAMRIRLDHDARSARLATLEDTLGISYRGVVAAMDGCRSELDDARRRLPASNDAHTAAIRTHAEAVAAAETAVIQRQACEQLCSVAHDHLVDLFDVPGLVGAATSDADEHPIAIPTTTGDADGVRELLAVVERFEQPTGDGTTADGVRQSLRSRRDSLGAGWDAEDRQPDPELPLSVSVDGPLGRMVLADAVAAVDSQLSQLTSLLTQKQDQALRALLQGLVAQEVAEKMFAATSLVDLMNERLATVTTAHGIGVRLRWRRSPELDDATRRTVGILAKRPDLRTEAEEADLRVALTERLDDARRLEPDAPYRHLIGQVFDYRRWHDMDVLLRRGGEPERPLGRRTPLSEGEKKLVTYLPLFAAVAASCDALADVSRNGHGATVPRFLLLDDAFAKVSEDNHAQLFGLLVDLDLDFIATSERLWGTHSTVPALAITEVVRDADLGVILLEHARWNGSTLSDGATR